MDICREQMPAYVEAAPNHKVACWLVEGKNEKAA
jgi:hypothetical protein